MAKSTPPARSTSCRSANIRTKASLVSANGAKLIRYNNGEWTEVNYVDNGDGTVTFETDKLGYFIFAEDYVAPKAKTNTLAIGIGAGVGGAAVLMAIIVVTVVVIKKKRA